MDNTMWVEEENGYIIHSIHMCVLWKKKMIFIIKSLHRRRLSPFIYFLSNNNDLSFSLYLSIYLSVYLYIYLSIYLSVNLTIYLSKKRSLFTSSHLALVRIYSGKATTKLKLCPRNISQGLQLGWIIKRWIISLYILRYNLRPFDGMSFVSITFSYCNYFYFMIESRFQIFLLQSCISHNLECKL